MLLLPSLSLPHSPFVVEEALKAMGKVVVALVTVTGREVVVLVVLVILRGLSR